MVLPIEVRLCVREVARGNTVVVTMMGGPVEGVTVTTTTLILVTGLLLLIGVTVVLGVPSDDKGSKVEVDLIVGVVCTMVLELSAGLMNEEGERVLELELDPVGPGVSVVVFRGIGKGASGDGI
jgi:hypothetical protein